MYAIRSYYGSKAYRWTKEQCEYQIKKKMKESGTTDKFIDFDSYFKNKHSKFIRVCKEHGEYSTTIRGYLYKGYSCPQCKGHCQKQSYINIIKDGGITVGLKFGIANDAVYRIKDHIYNSIFNVEQIGIWQFTDVESCKDAEKKIKKDVITSYSIHYTKLYDVLTMSMCIMVCVLAYLKPLVINCRKGSYNFV